MKSDSSKGNCTRKRGRRKMDQKVKTAWPSTLSVETERRGEVGKIRKVFRKQNIKNYQCISFLLLFKLLQTVILYGRKYSFPSNLLGSLLKIPL